MSSIYPYALRVNFGIFGKKTIVADSQPEFSWALKGTGEQTACKAELLSNGKIVWDSGWVKTEKQNVLYNGEKLKSGTTYEVRVSVCDQDGEESQKTAETFLTGLFEAWTAPWIAPYEDFGEGAVYFHRPFDFSGNKIEKAVLYCCGIGYQDIKINGQSVGGEVRLSPAVSSYEKRCYYTVDDVTKYLLQNGKNCLLVTVAQGWRRNIGPYLQYVGGREISFFGIPQLTAMLEVTFENGETVRIVTDEQWTCTHGPVTYANLFDGEEYDARLEDTDCQSLSVKVVPSPGKDCIMMAQELEDIQIKKIYTPVSVHEVGSGYIFDMGQNIAGVCKIHLPAGFEPGRKIILTHGELLNEMGDLYTAPLRDAKARDVYITGNSEKAVSWSPTFTYHGFRYVKIEGLDIEPKKDFVEGIQFYTDIDNESFFRCGSGLVNQIQNMIVMTERDNLHGIATDCPQRDERMGWMNDATVRFEELPYNFEASRLFPKIIRDITDTQVDGAITCTAPYVFGNRPADPVCSSFLVAAQMSFLHYGNKEIIREAYPALEAWNSYLESRSDDGIVNYSYYGDWAGPSDYCIGENESAVTPGVFMSTGYHYLNSKLLAFFANILGKETDVKKHEKRAEFVGNAMLKKWLQPDGTVCTGSQGCQAFALKLGILPEEMRKLSAEKLKQSVADAGNRITTGNLCTLYLFEMLAEYGYIDTAWELITKEDYPSWGFMLQNGATTVWERLELKKDPGMNSHCHPMYGAIGKWFYSHIAGVTPEAAGFEKVRIRPYIPSKLLSAQAVVHTCKGDIAVNWEKKYGKTILHTTIPCGVQAIIDVNGKSEEVLHGTYHIVIG